LPRDSAPIGIFFRLEILPSSYHSGKLFANTTINFACRIHEAVIVKPVLWFTEYKNGSLFEGTANRINAHTCKKACYSKINSSKFYSILQPHKEYVDTNLNGPFSYVSKFATADLSTVYCSGTFWYKELWMNISIDLELIGILQVKLNSYNKVICVSGYNFVCNKLVYRRDCSRNH